MSPHEHSETPVNPIRKRSVLLGCYCNKRFAASVPLAAARQKNLYQ